MAWNKRLAWTAFFSTLAGAAFAQDSSELAKELANPIASLISVPFQGNYDCCLGPSNADRWTFNVQPVVPLALNSDWNLIVRTIMPIVSIPTPSSTNASLESGSTVAENAAVNSIAAPTGLGDTLQSFFFSPQSPAQVGLFGAPGLHSCTRLRPTLLWALSGGVPGRLSWSSNSSRDGPTDS